MYRITFNLGVTFDKDGETIPNHAAYDALDAIEDRLIKEAGGYTVITTEGGYRSNSGHTVVEKGKQYVVLTPYGEDGGKLLAWTWARDMAQFMRRVLNQESVLLTVEKVNAEFVA